MRRILLLVVIALTMAEFAVAAAAEVAAESPRALLQTYCLRCHGGGDGEGQGEVDLSALFAAEPRGEEGELAAAHLNAIEKAIVALEDRVMPPEDKQQPTAAERAALVEQLRRVLNGQLQKHRRITRTPIRRMNRLEYNNAVKQLFQLRRDPFALPERTLRDFSDYFQPASGKMPETLMVGNRAMGKSQFLGKGNTLRGVAAYPKDPRAEHGFDNRGDHLSLSPVLMESFFALSQSILGSPDFKVHAGAWEPLFVVPEEMSLEEQRKEGERRLKKFLRQAFRGQVSEEVVGRYYGRFVQKLDGGATFSDSMKAAVAAALVSPRFLYLYAGADNEGQDESHDFALASRLATFLWSGTPDDELLTLAEQGKLREPQVLAAQVERMMNDRRLKNFCDSFALQWLQLDRMVGAMPDVARFRDYYFGGANDKIYMVGMHMMVEPLLVFETIVVEDRPVIELVDSDFTYRSDRLRQWYGKSPAGHTSVEKIKFRRFPVTDRRWGGVITNAAVLTMTSSPLRTKPITRGAWLATTIFNDPPQPPPADVPELPADDAELEKDGLTLRDQLQQHVANQECASCHRKIDPLGFALENYDPVGLWRDDYRTGLPIDSSGKLFGKHDFAGSVEFKNAIRAEEERFVRAFAGHLLSYAVGRELDLADRASLDQIVAKSGKEKYRFRSLIKEVILSASFRGESSAAVNGPEPAK